MHNPYNYHIAVRDDRMFFGREKILARLVSGLSAPLPLSAAILRARRSAFSAASASLFRLAIRPLSPASSSRLAKRGWPLLR